MFFCRIPCDSAMPICASTFGAALVLWGFRGGAPRRKGRWQRGATEGKAFPFQISLLCQEIPNFSLQINNM